MALRWDVVSWIYIFLFCSLFNQYSLRKIPHVPMFPRKMAGSSVPSPLGSLRFEFIEMTNTWFDLDSPSRDPQPLVKRGERETFRKRKSCACDYVLYIYHIIYIHCIYKVATSLSYQAHKWQLLHTQASTKFITWMQNSTKEAFNMMFWNIQLADKVQVWILFLLFLQWRKEFIQGFQSFLLRWRHWKAFLETTSVADRFKTSCTCSLQKLIPFQTRRAQEVSALYRRVWLCWNYEDIAVDKWCESTSRCWRGRKGSLYILSNCWMINVSVHSDIMSFQEDNPYAFIDRVLKVHIYLTNQYTSHICHIL